MYCSSNLNHSGPSSNLPGISASVDDGHALFLAYWPMPLVQLPPHGTVMFPTVLPMQSPWFALPPVVMSSDEPDGNMKLRVQAVEGRKYTIAPIVCSHILWYTIVYH